MTSKLSKVLLPNLSICRLISTTLLLCCIQYGTSIAFALDGADKSLTIEKLDNGLTVAIWEDRSKPIVTVDAWISVGSLAEDDSTWGIAHFFEHMFYRGSTNRPPRANRDEIIAVGGMTSAGTWYDYTHFYNKTPSAHFENAVDTLTDSLQNLTLPEDGVQLERAVITEEIGQRLDDFDIFGWEESLGFMFPDNRLGKRIIATPEAISRYTRDNFVKYYSNYYSPANTTIVVSGDVSPSAAIDLIRRKTSGWKTAGAKPEWKKPANAFHGFGGKDVTGKSNAAQLNIGFIVPGFRHPDRYALEVAENILLTGGTARLNAIKGSAVLGVWGGYQPFRDAGTFIFYVAPPRTGTMNDAAAAVISVIADTAASGVTDAEVRAAVSSLELAVKFYQEGTLERARLIGEAITYGNPDYYLNYVQNLRAVTAADVNRVLNSYFAAENCRIVYFRPQAGFGTGGEASLEAALEKLPNPGTPDFGKALYPDAVASRRGTGAPPKPAASDNKTVTLPDGMKVIIVNKPGAEVFSAGVFFPAGSAHDPAGREGLTSLTLSLLEYGTAAMTRQDVRSRIAALGGNFGTGVERDFSCVFITTTVEDAKTGIGLLKSLAENPALTGAAVQEAKNSQLAGISSFSEDIVSAGVEGFKQFAFQGHPYSNPPLGNPKSVAAIGPSDVKAHWDRMSNPAGAVFIVVGDARRAGIFDDPGASIGTVCRGTGEAFKPVPPPSAIGLTGTHTVKLQRQQNLAIIGAAASGIENGLDSEYGSLMTLGSLLSLRAFQEIVYEKGLAYRSVGAYESWRGGGPLMLYLGYSPASERQIFEAISDQIQRAAGAQVAADELAHVKGFVTGFQTVALEKTADQLLKYGQWEMTGAGFDFHSKFDSLINAATPESVQSAAMKYFAQDRLLVLLVKG